MAVGSLLGAGMFVIMVVSGVCMIVKSFETPSWSSLRDIITYMWALFWLTQDCFFSTNRWPFWLNISNWQEKQFNGSVFTMEKLRLAMLLVSLFFISFMWFSFLCRISSFLNTNFKARNLFDRHTMEAMLKHWEFATKVFLDWFNIFYFWALSSFTQIWQSPCRIEQD